MSTRLFVQTLLQSYYPNLDIRIWQPSNKPGEINIYIGNDSFSLDERFTSSIEKLLPCHLKYDFKSYDQLKQDNVPEELKLPPLVGRLALSDGGNQKSVKLKLEKGLPSLVPFEIHVATPENVIGIETENKFTSEELIELQSFAQELIPLGTWVNVFCKE